ncbi:hypothetical protein ABG067_002006 [Albugo candida]|uniref:Kazal-like domain-containing protein n=1 Tax=Albugo candida TaxID=65357 RepID=A0A024GLW8_9STRA|nr:unnamed protein product [Albugo candida]|eukprot:CCI47865.1 unnamed protein product [Albugo candida]
MANLSRTILFINILCWFMGCSAKVLPFEKDSRHKSKKRVPKSVCSKDNKQYESMCAFETAYLKNKNDGFGHFGDCGPFEGEDGSDCNIAMCKTHSQPVCKETEGPSKEKWLNSCVFRTARCRAKSLKASDKSFDRICTGCSADKKPENCEDLPL